MNRPTSKASLLDEKEKGHVQANKCTHDRYRQDDYMCHPIALKSDNIAWIGKIVEVCEDCGQNIEFAKRAKVMTAEQYLKSIGK